jgi:hypothetical protein
MLPVTRPQILFSRPEITDRSFFGPQRPRPESGNSGNTGNVRRQRTGGFGHSRASARPRSSTRTLPFRLLWCVRWAQPSVIVAWSSRRGGLDDPGGRLAHRGAGLVAARVTATVIRFWPGVKSRMACPPRSPPRARRSPLVGRGPCPAPRGQPARGRALAPAAAVAPRNPAVAVNPPARAVTFTLPLLDPSIPTSVEPFPVKAENLVLGTGRRRTGRGPGCRRRGAGPLRARPGPRA